MGRGALRRGALVGSIAAAVVAAGCQVSTKNNNVVNGKTLFVAKCGACHTLSRAQTKGITGPNLDMAFAQSRRDGFGQSTFAGVVERQIQQPSRSRQVDPATGKLLPAMPPNLVKGQDARDVATYVAQAVAVPGKDTGVLAGVGQQKAKGTAKEESGTLAIPTADSGLAYKFANAQAQAGKVTIESKNVQSIGHDIAIEGNGVKAGGKVVENGGTSEFSATLKPGTYTFFCTVPGHRQAGMVGKLTVK